MESLNQQALGQTLDALYRGVVVLDSSGRVTFSTERATESLVAYCHVGKPPRHRLPAELEGWVRRVAPPQLPLVIEREGRRLSIRLISDGPARVLLLEEHVDCLPTERLRACGLSAREAEVLAWVAQGKTNRGVASILGLSVLTIKKHLQHIFNKLGVETRTAATLRALVVLGATFIDGSPL